MSEETRYKSGRFKQKPRRWTDEEDQFVRDNIADMTHTEIADHLGRTVDSVKGYCERNKIRTPGGGRFQKGDEPWNKGKHPEDYLDEDTLERIRATQFEKGHTPKNAKWDGAITIRYDHQDRGGPPYLYIRLSKGNWEKYQRYLWEQEHGEIPDDKILVCKNGNTLNPAPDNWELITRAENARRNQNWRKAMQTMNEQENHPSKHLTDNYVAAHLAGGDQELKDYIKEHRPDLIRVARANYKLKRTINNNEEK